MRKIEVSIPGKVMLAGEYAVLRGGHALGCALSCGMTIEVIWDPNATSWIVESDIWNEPQIFESQNPPQTDILCRAVQYAAKMVDAPGGRVRIKSDIQITHGVGSSSALRVGICAAFLALKQDNIPNTLPAPLPVQALNAAWQLQSEGQGNASGYDIVCQAIGGLVEFSFEYEDAHWKPKWFRHSLEGLSQIVHVFVGGKGAPTTQTMQTMSSWLDGGNRFEKLMEVSETLVDAFNAAVQWPDANYIKKLAVACGAARGLFAASPMFPTNIAEALSNIPGLDKSWSWKTTGAGGEDAIILIGTKQSTKSASDKLKEIGWQPSGSHFSMNGGKIISFSTDETRSTSKDQTASRPTTSTRMREFLK